MMMIPISREARMALQWEDSAVTKILFQVLEVMPYLSEFPLCVSGLGSCYMYGSYQLTVVGGLLLHKMILSNELIKVE